MSHSRDVTMLLNEISLIYRFELDKNIAGQDDDNVQKRKVRRVIIHPEYKHSLDVADTPLPGDVAILKLEKPLRFDNDVGDPVTIPNSKLVKKAKRAGNCIAMGFGMIQEKTFTFPKRLQKILVNERSTSYCSRQHASMFGTRWNAKLLCTFQQGRPIICFGDDAVPLVCYLNRQPILLGTMVFSPFPCSDGHFAWTRMKSFRSWIRQYA